MQHGPDDPRTLVGNGGGPALPPGHELQEFVIEGVLGVGGFGIVYRARDTRLQRAVALKEYMPAMMAARGPGHANCFTFTDNPGVSIPEPTINNPTNPPNTNLPVANAYTARVTDAAGNFSEGSLTANFDYFTCNQARANATFGGNHQSVTSTVTVCQQCHRIFATTTTPIVTYVAVPMTNPSYWCRRPF